MNSGNSIVVFLAEWGAEVLSSFALVISAMTFWMSRKVRQRTNALDCVARRTEVLERYHARIGALRESQEQTSRFLNMVKSLPEGLPPEVLEASESARRELSKSLESIDEGILESKTAMSEILALEMHSTMMQKASQKTLDALNDKVAILAKARSDEEDTAKEMSKNIEALESQFAEFENTAR